MTEYLQNVEIARLSNPKTLRLKADFISEYNHRRGLKIVYEESGDIVALDYSEEDKKAMQEENRLNQIKMLNMTRLDFINCLEKLGITYANIKAMMANYPEMEKELQYCSNVYRGNGMLDAMVPVVNKAFGLNISSNDLDLMFITKCDRQDLLPVEDEEIPFDED